jgi:hypothetical protein
MVTKKSSKTRGSKKLSASKKAGGTSALEKSVRSLDRAAIKNGILINGIPFPDIIKGSVIVKPSAVGGTLNTLLKIPGAQYKPVQLFPKGIPVIDQVTIKIDGKIKQ